MVDFYSAFQLRQLAIQKHGSDFVPIPIVAIARDASEDREALASTAIIIHAGLNSFMPLSSSNYSKQDLPEEEQFDQGNFFDEFVRFSQIIPSLMAQRLTRST